MLSGNWSESYGLRPGAPSDVTITNCDSSALLIVLKIIHGRMRKVPKSVSLELLSEIAVITDFYDCSESVEVFRDNYVKQWDINTLHQGTIFKWLCISWIFRSVSIFADVTRMLQLRARGPPQSLDLPIPGEIISEIDVPLSEKSIANSHFRSN